MSAIQEDANTAAAAAVAPAAAAPAEQLAAAPVPSTEQQSAAAPTSTAGAGVAAAAAFKAPANHPTPAEQTEKNEEEKLMAKYPTAGGGGLRGNGPSGHSAFLQKRLQKGQKYFDSGDYQMAKQKGGGIKQVFANKVTTGDTIPTPESVPARKTSIIQPCNKFTSS